MVKNLPAVQEWKWKSLSHVRLFERVHGIFQARVLAWVAFPFSRGSSQPRDQIQVSSIAGRFFTSWVTREALGAGDACSIPWVGKIPWRRAWQITPVFLPGESPWKEEPGRLQSRGSQRVRHDWLTLSFKTEKGVKTASLLNSSLKCLPVTPRRWDKEPRGWKWGRAPPTSWSGAGCRVQTKGGPGDLSTPSQSWNVTAIPAQGQVGKENPSLHPMIYLLEIKIKLI